MAATRYIHKTLAEVDRYAHFMAENLPKGAEMTIDVDGMPCTLEDLASVAFEGRKVRIAAKSGDDARTDLFLVRDKPESAAGETSALADLTRAFQEERRQATQTITDLFRIVGVAAKGLEKATKSMSKMLNKTSKAHNRMAELEVEAAERKTGLDAAKEALEMGASVIGPEKMGELLTRVYEDFTGRGSDGDAHRRHKKRKKHKRVDPRNDSPVPSGTGERGSPGKDGGDVSPTREDAS